MESHGEVPFLDKGMTGMLVWLLQHAPPGQNVVQMSVCVNVCMCVYVCVCLCGLISCLDLRLLRLSCNNFIDWYYHKLGVWLHV